MLKKFTELSKVEVKATKKPVFKWNEAKRKHEQVGELDVVSWVDCLKALYDNGAEKVTFENVRNETGGLIFVDENKSISIKVYVDIDGDRREIYYPVINGTSDIKIEKVTQSDIYNAKQRAFVKCVAVNWGLGISYWEKENPDEVLPPVKESFSETFRGVVNQAIKSCGGVKEMLSHLSNVTRKDIDALIQTAVKIDGISSTLNKVIEDISSKDKKEEKGAKENDKKSEQK